ncbi:MAG: uroporphyrinogen-III synthase, partial [Halocynthiibacter sp.]
RPKVQAARFASAVQARLGAGQEIVISPLIRIELLTVAQGPKHYSGVIFTSENAVAAARQAPGLPAYCVGDHTARAATARGFAALSAGGDSTDLVAMIRDRTPVGPLLHLRGEHSSGEVAETLRQSGIAVDELVVYRQMESDLNDTAKSLLARGAPVIVPLFSPRSAALFARKAHASIAPLVIIALSEAVANLVRGRFRGDVMVCGRPDASHMLDAIADASAD